MIINIFDRSFGFGESSIKDKQFISFAIFYNDSMLREEVSESSLVDKTGRHLLVCVIAHDVLTRSSPGLLNAKLRSVAYVNKHAN